MAKRELVDIEVEIIAQTEKAVKVTDGKTTCWLPLSQVEVERAKRCGEWCTVVTMPEPLALEKGLI